VPAQNPSGKGELSDGSSPAQVAVFARSGDYWAIGLGSARSSLKDIKGLGYILQLLQHPGREFHALELISSGSGAVADTIVGPEEALPIGVTVRHGLSGDAGEMLDAEAKREYKRRLDELSEMLEDQRERGNHERADEIEGEIEDLRREIARGVGIGGRDRRAGTNAERARLSVSRAIKTAIQQIAEQQAALGELLERCIRTGSFCSYAPNVECPVTWQFSIEGSDLFRVPEEALAAGDPCPAETSVVPVTPSTTGLRQDRGVERRHLTVLFCDLVNSTDIAAQLDPEEWREIVATYHRAATDAIAQLSGHVAKSLGDGVMAFFGYPEAHENNAERAVRAGLAILEAISDATRGLAEHHKIGLAARVGIDSGQVVVGEGGQGIDVFGAVPNIASGVQTAAEPNSVLITASVLQLVPGQFVVEDRGAQTLKGVPQPVQLYRVSRATEARGRLQAWAVRGLTPFVGREEELRLLTTRWELAREGEGQFVLVVGEPGIGKSRLLQQFHEHFGGSQHVWIQVERAPYYQNSPFSSAADLMQQGLGWRGDESVEDKLGQLGRALEQAELKVGEAVSLIAPLLNLPVPEIHAPLRLSPEQQRKRLLATLAGWILGKARTRPLVIVMEDLQWVDPSTLELQQLLVEQGVSAPLLLLCTARPEFRVPWPTRAHHTQITLSRLNRSQAREMVTRVAASAKLSEDVLDVVVDRAGGVPLFAEELTRAVLEDGTAEAVRTIPATLQDSLMARLDRLGPAKDAAQIAAVIGREFSYELLQAVSPMSEEELQSALARLADAELIYARGIPPEASYQFKHALVLDTAYEALLKSRRRELHRRVAERLAEKFPEVADARPEILARHWTEAGAAEPAVAAWRKAGRRAIERFANTEAVANLSRALEVLNKLPESRERDTKELGLQMLLTTPLIAIEGYSAPEVEKACYRARDLSNRIGDTPHLFSILGGLNSIYRNRGEFPTALELANQMLGLAERNDDPVMLVWAYNALGMTSWVLVDFASSRDHFERSIAHYNFQEPHSYGWVQDPGATGLSALAWILHALGYPEQALRKQRQAIDWARKLADPYTLQSVLSGAWSLHFERGEFQTALRTAEERMAVCKEHGFEFVLQEAIAQRGLALTGLDRKDEGIGQLHELLESLEAEVAAFRRRIQFREPERLQLHRFYLAAVAYWKSGQPLQGLKALADEQELSKEVGRQMERLRLKGNLLLLLKDAAKQAEAEQLFRSAIQIERSCGAKWSELLSTTALARLLRDTGRREEARAMLADIYNWFTEGFDLSDLKDAKVLLDELGNSP
jgi:class 3 adenylate cyclase